MKKLKLNPDMYMTEDELKRYRNDSKRSLRARLGRKYPILNTLKLSDLLTAISLTPLTAMYV